MVEETGVPGENHRPVTSHWETLSHVGFKHQRENKQNSDKKHSHLIQCDLNLILYRILSSVKIGHHSCEFRCRLSHLSCKLRPEIDNRFTFTLIKKTMRFKQIRKNIYRCWCQNGAILLLSFWLKNQIQSQIFSEKNSP